MNKLAEPHPSCSIKLLALVFLSVSTCGWAEETVVGPSSAPVAAVSSSDFETVCQRLRAVKRVDADFTEEKTLHLLSHPLRSKGTLTFAPGQGIYRVMTEPAHQELLITHSQFVQKDAQGDVQRMRIKGQPAAEAFVNVFLSFFAGDSRAWEKAFTASFSGSVDRWKIEFTPRRKSPAGKALKRILLEGHEGALDAMTITEANGDATRTQYLNQRLSHSESEAAVPFPQDLR